MTDTNTPLDSGATDKRTKPRILVADDSKLVRKTAEKFLASNFDLVLVEDGEQALQAISDDESIQVLFTDLGMPNLDGYGLIQKIRQSDQERIRDLPVIVITGAKEDESVRRKVFEVGATDFVTKPFKSTELIARAEAHASYRSNKDSLQKNIDVDLLTGTLNGKGIKGKLDKDVSFINRHHQNLALVVFEIDDFKNIAEKIKKQASEKIIKHISGVLGNAIRKEDSFGRYEFAKFATILPMAKTEGVIQLAKRLCENVKSVKVSVGGDQIALTLSVGIAAVQKGDTALADNLMSLAEKALTNAKAVGPGEVQILKLEESQSRGVKIPISIDGVLEQISLGQKDDAEFDMEAVLARLAPLMRIMTDEQKQQLIR